MKFTIISRKAALGNAMNAASPHQTDILSVRKSATGSRTKFVEDEVHETRLRISLNDNICFQTEKEVYTFYLYCD